MSTVCVYMCMYVLYVQYVSVYLCMCVRVVCVCVVGRYRIASNTKLYTSHCTLLQYRLTCVGGLKEF